jgi:hypothetical protein
MARPPSKKRMARFTELTRQMKADPEIVAVVQNFVDRAKLGNVGELAQRKPKDFDLMCAAIDDLLEQAPIETAARWMS